MECTILCKYKNINCICLLWRYHSNHQHTFFQSSSWTPECDASKEPKVGMIFNDIQSAQDFYIAYASHVGFSVRVGQQKKKDGVVLHKRFLCSKWRIPCRESKEHKWIHQKEEMWQKNQVVGNTITPQNFRWIQFVLSACQKKKPTVSSSNFVITQPFTPRLQSFVFHLISVPFAALVTMLIVNINMHRETLCRARAHGHAVAPMSVWVVFGYLCWATTTKSLNRCRLGNPIGVGFPNQLLWGIGFEKKIWLGMHQSARNKSKNPNKKKKLHIRQSTTSLWIECSLVFHIVESNIIKTTNKSCSRVTVD